MAAQRIDEIKNLLKRNSKVYVNDLSARFGVSRVSIRKDLTRLEDDGVARRFYGGAQSVESWDTGDSMRRFDPTASWYALARRAADYVDDGDTIFVGSGRSCCVLAEELGGRENLTVVTNNITALSALIENAARVYLIGGEVTSTDHRTLFSSWESPQAQLGNIFVNKAFTSISGLDLKAGLTVDSIISTYVFKHIPAMAHRWYLMADQTKFGKISIYPVADLERIHTLITDAAPPDYMRRFTELNIEVISVDESGG